MRKFRDLASLTLLGVGCSLIPPFVTARLDGPTVELAPEQPQQAYRVRACYDGEVADSMRVEVTLETTGSTVAVSITDIGEVLADNGQQKTIEEWFDDPERIFAWMCLDGFEARFDLVRPVDPATVRWSIFVRGAQDYSCNTEIHEDEIVIEIEPL